MLHSSGILSQKDYFVALGKLYLVTFATVAVLAIALDSLDAERSGASMLAQTASVVLFLALIGSVIYGALYYITLALKRGRDAGNAVLWAVIGSIIPFGFIIIGLPSSTKQMSTGR
jgi:uncharacterized membrane protein YhaH (DUF805 family)